MCLQKPPKIPVVEHHVLQVYKQIYKKYLNERRSIPHQNLIEICYEDFIQRPLDHIKEIYSRLELDGFQASEETFKKYIASQEHVKTQRYMLDDSLKERIYSEWKFAFDAFNYEK